VFVTHDFQGGGLVEAAQVERYTPGR